MDDIIGMAQIASRESNRNREHRPAVLAGVVPTSARQPKPLLPPVIKGDPHGGKVRLGGVDTMIPKDAQ